MMTIQVRSGKNALSTCTRTATTPANPCFCSITVSVHSINPSEGGYVTAPKSNFSDFSPERVRLRDPMKLGRLATLLPLSGVLDSNFRGVAGVSNMDLLSSAQFLLSFRTVLLSGAVAHGSTLSGNFVFECR